jgi:hypothetical protein
MKNNFTKADVGASVVFAGFDGGSYSATIVNVTNYRGPGNASVQIKYHPVDARPFYAVVNEANFSRLTRFPVGCNFLAVESTFSK